MPSGFQALDQGTPELNTGMSADEKMGEILSKFVMLLESLKYVLSNLSSENFNEAGLAEITEPITGLITDIEGNVAALALTSMGLQLDVSNVEGDLTSLSVTVDGMRIGDETGSYTVIDGDRLISKDHDTSATVEIENGTIYVHGGEGEASGYIGTSITEGFVIANNSPLSNDIKIVTGLGTITISGALLKLIGEGNLSIDSGGTIYIGTSSGYSGDVNIGNGTGTININGAIVNVNGVPI